MRLIDAVFFVENIKTEISNLKLDGLKGTPRPTRELYDIIDRINEQPTAYDVNAVTEQLKEEREKAYREKESIRFAQGQYEAYGKAIEIVKAGGAKCD